MKLRNKIFAGIAIVFVSGICSLMITVSYDSPCPPPPPLAAGTESMRAVMNRCYGIPRGVRLETIAKPVPGDGRVLIKVQASSVNPAEWYGISGKPYIVRLFNGIGSPKDFRAGYDVAGTVEAVGANVTRCKPGDEVFGGAYGAMGE